MGFEPRLSQRSLPHTTTSLTTVLYGINVSTHIMLICDRSKVREAAYRWQGFFFSLQHTLLTRCYQVICL